MSRNIFQRSFFKIAVSLFALFVSFFLAGGEFRIAATADLHGNLRALALLAPQIRAAAPDILADAGDLTGGNLLAELDGGHSMIQALNLLKYDFRIPGNHDFDCASEAFIEQCRLFNGMTLGADWSWKNRTGLLYKTVSKEGFKVGVIGLTEPNIQRRHLPIASGPVFRDWRQVLRSAVDALRREKVHFTVLIWHNGREGYPSGVKNVLKDLRGVDLVIAAHSHKEHPGTAEQGIFIVQPGAYASSASLVRIRYNDQSFAVEKVNTELLRPLPGRSARDIEALNKASVKPYYPAIFRKVCRKGDLSYGSFPRLGAEALRQKTGTQGAVFLTGIPDRKRGAGHFYKDLFSLLPYRNTLCTVELTPGELTALLQDLQQNNSKYKRLMGISGFRWNFRKRALELQRLPAGKISLTVSSYLMVSSPVLRPLLREKAPRWRHKEITERETVAEFLQSRIQRH